MISYSFKPNSSFSWTESAPPPWRRFGKRRDGRGEKRRQCSIVAVKRLLALVLGALGLKALLKRRRERATVTSPANDLKEKLAESRTVAEPEQAPPAPPVADAEPSPPPAAEPAAEPDVDERRADVHARARQAMDELS
jgi:hypothetical protein